VKDFLKQNDAVVLKSIVSVVVRLLGTLSGFIITLLVAKTLGAESAGLYFLSFTVVTFLAVACRLGLDMTVIKFTGRSLNGSYEGSARDVLHRAIVLTSILAGIVSVLVFSFSESIAINIFNKHELFPLLKSFSLSIVPVSLLAITAMSMQGLQKSILSVFSQTLVINLLLCVLFFLPGGSLSADDVAMFYTLSIACVFFVFFSMWYRWLSNRPSGRVKVSYKLLLDSSLPLWFFTMTNQLIQWSGIFVVGIFETSESVAVFSVTQRLANMLTILFMSVNMVIAPKLAQLSHDGEKIKVIALLRNSILLTIAISFIPVLLLLCFPQWLLGLFGSEFESGAVLLMIMVAGYLFNVITGPLEVYLSMSNNEKELKKVALVLGPLAVTANVLLVYLFGVQGAAYATAGILIIQKSIVIYFVKKTLRVSLLDIWLPSRFVNAS